MVNEISMISTTILKNGNNNNCNETPFEEALALAGFGRFNIYVMLFCGLMLLGMILETLGFSYIIPACQCDLQLSLAEKGWLAAIPFIGIIITSHMWGFLADTRGRKKILIFCMSVGSFISIISSFSPNLITFACLRMVAGLFISGPSALGYAYLGELNPSHQRDKMITLGNASVAIGTAVVPALAWAVLPLEFSLDLGYMGYRPWRVLVCLFALPYVVCAILMMKFPESPKFLMSKGDSEGTLKVLQHIYSVNSGKAPDEFPVTHLKSEVNVQRNPNEKRSFFRDVCNQTLPLFTGKYLKYTIIACFLQIGSFATSNGFYIWFPAILNKVLEQSELDSSSDNKNICDMLGTNKTYNDNAMDDINIFRECDDSLKTGTFSISIMLAVAISTITIGSAFLINFLGKRNILVAFFLLCGVSAFALHWVTDTITSITMFSFLQLCGTCIGLVSAFVVEIFPTNVRAMAVCLTLMMGRVGSVVGTNLIGYLIENSCPTSFFLFGVLLFLSAALCFTLPAKKSKSQPRVTITKF